MRIRLVACRAVQCSSSSIIRTNDDTCWYWYPSNREQMANDRLSACCSPETPSPSSYLHVELQPDSVLLRYSTSLKTLPSMKPRFHTPGQVKGFSLRVTSISSVPPGSCDSMLRYSIIGRSTPSSLRSMRIPFSHLHNACTSTSTIPPVKQCTCNLRVL
jgi:hypothetical protein